MLKINQEVNHNVFGKGHIIDIVERVEPNNYKYSSLVIVEFDNAIQELVRENFIWSKRDIKTRTFTEFSILPYIISE